MMSTAHCKEVSPMNRRNLLLGLAMAGLDLNAQEPSPGSLYIPKPHLVEDRKFLQDFMDEFAFADLVTASPGIRITHIPTVLDRTAAPYGTLFGHISRQNLQSKCFDGHQQAVIVFRGPHSPPCPSPRQRRRKEARRTARPRRRCIITSGDRGTVFV